MAVTTTRLIIVCTEAEREHMNATLNNLDPQSVGDVMVATVALPSDPSTVVGRRASWAMTGSLRSSVVGAFSSNDWAPLRGSEKTVLQPGQTVPGWGSQRFWLFDGDTWGEEDVLSSLGLVRSFDPNDE